MFFRLAWLAGFGERRERSTPVTSSLGRSVVVRRDLFWVGFYSEIAQGYFILSDTRLG
jgi:hypothetical protein